MTTVADMKLEIIRHLGDEVEENSEPIAGSGVSAAALLGGIQAALRALTIKLWKQSSIDIDVDEDGVSSIEIPSDFIAVEAVYDNENEIFLPRLLFSAGSSLVQDEQNAWIDYPYGSITFMTSMTLGGKMYYSAHWASPVDDDEDIEAPLVAMNYLSLYATSYILMGKASAQAEIRQFATKVDSGTPIMLPAKDLSHYFLQRAEIELKNVPSMMKGST